MTSKPLKFRNQGVGAGLFAQRNYVEYYVRYNYWKDGEKADAPYYVDVYDRKTQFHVSTERTRRFASQDEAFKFCQDICEGRINRDDLAAEVQAILDAEEAAHKDKIDRQVEDFRSVMAAQGVSLKAFLTCLNKWDNLWSDTQSTLWRSLAGDGEGDAR